jgi:hypothetical protein
MKSFKNYTTEENIFISFYIFSFIIILFGLYILPLSTIIKGIIIHPIFEECIKFPFIFLFIIFFVKYLNNKQEKDLKKAGISFLVFFLLIFIFLPLGDIFNPNVGVNITFFNFLRQYVGHFSFTVIGAGIFGLFYTSNISKKYLIGLTILSLIISIFLHSIANQFGHNVFIGNYFLNNGFSQFDYIRIISIIGVIFFLAFILFQILKNRK